MNIFASDESPLIAARNLDDKRVVKMIVESAQILSTAMHIHGERGPYRPTHQNHPCVVWAAATKGNYNWVFEHLLALLTEYKARYGDKLHATAKHCVALYEGVRFIPEGALQPFVNCARNASLGVDFHDVEDTVLAYRLYLKERWSKDVHKPRWGKNPEPADTNTVFC